MIGNVVTHRLCVPLFSIHLLSSKQNLTSKTKIPINIHWVSTSTPAFIFYNWNWNFQIFKPKTPPPITVIVLSITRMNYGNLTPNFFVDNAVFVIHLLWPSFVSNSVDKLTMTVVACFNTWIQHQKYIQIVRNPSIKCSNEWILPFRFRRVWSRNFNHLIFFRERLQSSLEMGNSMCK